MTPAVYLERGIKETGYVEVRAKTLTSRWVSGLFADPWLANRAIEKRDDFSDIYCTLNRPRPRRVANRWEEGDEHFALTDNDMERIVRIPFDFDPIRPTGLNSTGAELQNAREARMMVVSALSSAGWPNPALGESGNGAHALYRCSIPSGVDLKEALRILYCGIHHMFESEFERLQVSFDRTVRNPSRIFRLYGFMNRKGPNTDDRPQRMTSIWIPPDWQSVSPKLISSAATRWKPKDPSVCCTSTQARRISGKGDYKSLDIIEWFRHHGLYKKHIAGNVHVVDCPWKGEHTSHSWADTIIYSTDGGSWPGFFCHHAHCAARKIRAVMDFFGDADRFCGRQYESLR